MDYVTTNIRISEEDYLRLKAEAAKKRKSFSAILREKLSADAAPKSSAEVAKILRSLNEHAEQNTKYLKGFDIVKALREMRYEDKW